MDGLVRSAGGLSCRAEAAELEDAVVSDEDVCRLNVEVKNVILEGTERGWPRSAEAWGSRSFDGGTHLVQVGDGRHELLRHQPDGRQLPEGSSVIGQESRKIVFDEGEDGVDETVVVGCRERAHRRQHDRQGQANGARS